MKTILANLTTAEMSTLKKLGVVCSASNLESPVSIIHVTLATIDHCKNNNLDYSVKSIVGLIRKNRELSTLTDHADMVTFNPTLTITGTNPRLFPDFYNQYVNLKNDVYATPETATPATLETAIPEIIVEPETPVIAETAKPAKIKKSKKA